jgi:hypothetical protein
MIVRIIKRFRQPSIRLLIAVWVLACGIASSLHAAAQFPEMTGPWTGVGEVQYADSRREAVRCSAHHTEADQKLHLTMRCLTATHVLQFRGQLSQQDDRISGTWDELEFSTGGVPGRRISGEVSGRVSAGVMSLSIAGEGLTGSMSVTYDDSKQTIVMSVEGVPLKTATLTMMGG